MPDSTSADIVVVEPGVETNVSGIEIGEDASEVHLFPDGRVVGGSMSDVFQDAEEFRNSLDRED